MPRLPDYTALGQSPVPQRSGGIVAPEPADFRQLGPALSGVGQEIEQASAIVAETNQRQDAMVAEAAVNKLHAQSIELQSGDNGFARAKGGNAVGQPFLDGYQQRFDDQASQIENSLENDAQRRMFQARVPMVSLRYRSSLLKHQAAETDRFNEQTDSDTVDRAREQIFEHIGDPAALAGGFAQIDRAIDNRGQRMGWAPEVVAQTKVQFHQKVFEDTATVLVEQNPGAALAAMDRRMGIGQPAAPSGNAAFDALPVPKLVELRHRANAYVTQAANRAQAESERRLSDAQSATKELQEFALTGQMVDPAYEKEIIAKTIGTPYEPVARTLIAGSMLGSMHGSQTLPQQHASLQQLDARLSEQGSSPEQAKFVQRAREITAAQERAYKEDPWAAATRFAKRPEVQQAQIGDASQVPKLVAQRLPLMSGVETYAGAPVSPLMPAEAKDFADRLKALPPDARAEVLGQTGAMLSAPRAAALADQLDKQDKPLALALKMGLDRTTAGRTASTLVLRGAQALADKTVKKDESALSGWRHDIALLVRGSLGDDQAEGDVIDAAYFVRAAQEQEGIATPGFTRGVGSGAEDAVAMVIGQPITRGGLKTVLPRGMKEADFDTKLKAYTPDRLRELAPAGEVYVRGAPVKVEQIASHLGEYGLKRDGAGRYVPVVRNAPITLDAQGQNLLRLEVK
jgi:hypothetical protein